MTDSAADIILRTMPEEYTKMYRDEMERPCVSAGDALRSLKLKLMITEATLKIVSGNADNMKNLVIQLVGVLEKTGVLLEVAAKDSIDLNSKIAGILNGSKN